MTKTMAQKCRRTKACDIKTIDDYRGVINNMLCKYTDELVKKGNVDGANIVREVLRRQMEINRAAFIDKEG